MKKRPTMFRRLHGGEHRGRKVDKFYKRKAWLKLRAYILSQQPLCADPFREHEEHGEVTAANQVDHILSRKLRPDLELDPENLQGLCQRCHSKKTNEERE